MAKFFIVDDEKILHELYGDILKIKGHEVLGEAYNGEECLDMIVNNGLEPDFILMDHRMPVKNGLEATKELLKSKPNLKIIFVSADISIKNKALEAGALDFIKKPFDLKTLFERLDKISE